MIDFEEMKHRQEDGLKEIATLQEDETMVLKHFCSLATEALLKLGVKRRAPVDEVVVNSFRNGIALGLRLRVVAGEVQGR